MTDIISPAQRAEALEVFTDDDGFCIVCGHYPDDDDADDCDCKCHSPVEGHS